MYICEVCNRTYHWVCLKNTGCYTERQRREVDKACPGCAHLNEEQKLKRYSESNNTELIHMTWEPTWEPQELKDTLPCLLDQGPMQMHMHPNFLQPTPLSTPPL